MNLKRLESCTEASVPRSDLGIVWSRADLGQVWPRSALDLLFPRSPLAQLFLE
ncbi:hypothetical protein HRbin34_00109 [bacterium HR34]|nr:hypothetical protein HRbin34_00109 [bacterium HR34]